MKKKGFAIGLMFLVISNTIGGVTCYASEIQQENIGILDITEGNIDETSVVQEESMDEDELIDEAEADVEAVKELETNEKVCEITARETNQNGFQGEVLVDETAINVVDKDGNVTYIDASKDDTIVKENSVFRASTPQIVNFRYKSGVINYKEIATGVAGYTSGAYGSDGLYLGTNGNNIKFMLAGVIGEVPAQNVQVVSKTSVKSLSYYMVSNGRLYHYIATDVNSSKYGSTLDNGLAPSYLTPGTKYYSYDGHYFYTDANFGNMIGDYNNGVRNYSVNKNNPFYNYFQYLPLRSQSNYTGNSLNTVLNNRVTSTSKMRNTGYDFINFQNKYGVNALLLVGIGANESGWGTSSIAQRKNNLFGLNAVDSSPGESANYFSSVNQCIKEFAEKWMSKEYLNPSHWKCFGGFLGNKASGINVKYASDPYWGEKAAAMAWSLERSNGNKDVYKYTLGIKDIIKPNNVVNIRKESTPSSKILYKTKKNANCAYIVLENNPINNFYKIQSDGVLTSNRNSLDSSTGIYDFRNMYAYISSDYIKIVQKGNQIPINPPVYKDGWVTEGGKKYYYLGGEKVKGEKQIDGKWYCFDSNNGAMITGWHNLPGKKVYYQPTGEITYGEYNINGDWYYFQKDTGRMLTGWQNFDGRQLYYKETGKMVHGEYQIDNKWYYFNEISGNMQTGFVQLETKTVYYESNGQMVYGKREIDGVLYEFHKDTGAMKYGWSSAKNGEKVYLIKGGLTKGEKQIEGEWYLFDEKTGYMKTGFVQLGERKVYYKPSGEMVHGEYRIDGKWYYFHVYNGGMQTGFVELGDKTAYYASNGQMIYGKHEIDGVLYEFHKDTGAMKYGWSNAKNGEKVYLIKEGLAKGEKQIEGEWYLFDEKTGYMQTGFVQLGERKVYYKPDGEMVHGEYRIDEKWYYFDVYNGGMKTGFVNLAEKTVYYDWDGTMVYGEKKIKDKWYYFQKDTGRMEKNKVINGYYYGKDGVRV